MIRRASCGRDSLLPGSTRLRCQPTGASAHASCGRDPLGIFSEHLVCQCTPGASSILTSNGRLLRSPTPLPPNFPTPFGPPQPPNTPLRPTPPPPQPGEYPAAASDRPPSIDSPPPVVTTASHHPPTSPNPSRPLSVPSLASLSCAETHPRRKPNPLP